MGIGICANCKEQKEIESKGMCNNCYRYWKRHGKPRPTDTDALRRRSKHTHCVNCGALRTRSKHRRSLGAHGMCNTCYQFWWVNGRMRTDADKIRPKNKAAGICRNCKQNTELWRGLCQACYTYKRQHGKNRPMRLFREECSNCHVPLNGYKSRQGRCKLCQNYTREFGKERPAHVWKAPHGWCDCSDGSNPVPATHTVTVPVHKHIETLPMCDDCYAEHQRQVRWYGEIEQPTNRGRKGASQP